MKKSNQSSKLYALLVGLLFLLGLGTPALYAQQVISNGGSTFQNAQGSLTFTLGEPISATFSQSGTNLTQGFLQPSPPTDRGTQQNTGVYELPLMPPAALLLLAIISMGLLARQLYPKKLNWYQ